MAEGSILIVDDEYGVRSGIRTILEMEGYEVAEAGDGAGGAARPWTSATTTSPCSTTACPTPTASACSRP